MIAAEALPQHNRVNWPCLLVGMLVMVGGTAYPLFMSDPHGRPDHGLATALFWAMSAGFVRGVGFIPRARPLRWVFSGWACVVSLLAAAWLGRAYW